MYSGLPKNEATFFIDHVGSITNWRYEGHFTVRCVLNIGQLHDMELEKTRMLGDSPNPTPGLRTTASLIATIRAYIISAPAWWKDSRDGAEILDDEVLVIILDKINECSGAWREALKPPTNGDSSGN